MTEPDDDALPHDYDSSPCAVGAFGVVRVPVGRIADLRKAPGPSVGTKIPPSLLKHADHQTVLSLAAVLRAAADFGWSDRGFGGWAVVAAPRFLGRINTAKGLAKFQQSGVPGMSPLIIPTMSLHAVAGSVSLALGAHGFNYGVGGGPNHVAEALLAGLAARDDCGAPGVWVVASGFDPEPVPDESGNSLTPSTGYGVALAFTAGAEAARSRLNVRVVPASACDGSSFPRVEPGDDGGEPLTALIALADFLDARDRRGPGPDRWHCPVTGVGTLELDDDPARASATAGDGLRSSRAG